MAQRELGEALGVTQATVADWLTRRRPIPPPGTPSCLKSYGRSRLEAACARAVNFGTLRYRAVKAILAKGLDQATPQPAAGTALADTYTRGGRFCRDTQTLLH